jgi:hypothetical protein
MNFVALLWAEIGQPWCSTFNGCVIHKSDDEMSGNVKASVMAPHEEVWKGMQKRASPS